MAPRAVLLKTGLKSVNTTRPVNTVRSVNTGRPFKYLLRPFYKRTALTKRSYYQNVNTGTQRFNTGRQNVNTVRARGFNASNSQLNDKGFVNSGCSRHMTGNITHLSDFKGFDGGYVTFGGGAYGGRITGKDGDKKNYILLKIPRQDNMYSFDMKNIVPKDSLTCLVAKATSEESMLWHRRLGHINFKNINKLVKENLVRDLPLKRFENDQTCVACLKGKQHRASCKTKAFNPITKPLFMLHMDLFGPTFVSSLMHKKYCLVVTDDYSRFSWVFFLSTKDETTEILKNFIKEVENLVDKKVKIIRSDNGTEFKNKVMDDFCREKGIKREYSVARTPQQNGVAERKNRTLIEAARTMLADSKLPTTFWAEAVSTACYCIFTILNTLDKLGKFDGKSDEGFFVGYSLSSKAFRVYNTRTRKVQENLHIGFLENKPMIEGNGPKWLFDLDSLTQSMNYVPVVAGTFSNDFAGKQGVSESSTSSQQDQDCIVMPIWKDASYFGDDAPRSLPRCSRYKIKIGTKYMPSKDTQVEFQRLELGNIPQTYAVPTTHHTRIYKDHPIDHEEPKRVSKALSDLAWVEAMQRTPTVQTAKVLEFLWIYLKVIDAIGTKCVYRNKKMKGGFVNQNKARLGAQGHTKKWVINYDESVCTCARNRGNKNIPGLCFIYGIYGLPNGCQKSTKKELCDEFEKLLKDKFQMSSMDNLPSFGLTNVKSASTLTNLEKPWFQDGDVAEVDEHPVFPKTSHLLAVKRIFRYLKGKPSLGLWYPKDSPLELVAYTDSDYAGATRRKEVKPLEDVLWIQNQLLDYGYNFMNTVIYIDNTIMANLEFCDKHNMVAFLEKSTGSAGFHQIIDFLNRSHICYALTKKPDVCVSFIIQFWRSAEVSTAENGEVKITTTIDGHSLTITEGSLRRHLKLDDQDGLSSIPNSEIFEQLARMGYHTDSDKLTFQKGAFSPQWRFLIHNILHCLSPKKTAWEQFSNNIAAALICLATNRKYNFSRMIFEHMVSNISSPHKFLMYPRPTKAFSRQEVSLFPTMLDVTAPSTSPSRITSSPSPSPEPSPSHSPEHLPASSPTPEHITVASSQPSPTHPSLSQPSPRAEHHLPTPNESPIYVCDEGRLQINELMNLVTKLSDRIGALEDDLKKTKKTYNSAYTKLILRGRKLSEEEVQEKTSTETELFIQEVTPTEVIQAQKGSDKGSDEVSTAGAKKGTAREEVLIVSTAEVNLSITGQTVMYTRRSAEKRSRQDKGKAIMIESEPKKKSKKELKQERLSFAKAIRLEEQMNKEQRAQIARDKEIAK
ncbi:putative ribonuclease H-like domain-containing protein [Tanacetum coccineum]